MNPRKTWDFLRSRFGMFVLFVIVLFVGLWLYGRHQDQQQQVAKHTAEKDKKIEIGQVRVPLEKGLEDGLPQQAPPQAAEPGGESAGDGQLVPFRPAPPPAAVAAPPPPALRTVAEERKAPEKPRKRRFATLLASYTPTPASARPASVAPPDRFIPFGTLLKCKLVNTVDTANIETPVIAILLEDVWQNDERVIPANTLVHGTARAGRIRDRVNAAGAWRFVWQDGRELPFSGVALDREYDHEIDGYGITDGSAGMKGRLMASDDYQELKMLASAALSGFARGTQDRTQSVIGTTITGSVSNGVREGVGEVFDLYAQRTLRDIEQNGHYVRVSAGKEFYVYVLQSVNPDKAKVAGEEIDASWSSDVNTPHAAMGEGATSPALEYSGTPKG